MAVLFHLLLAIIFFIIINFFGKNSLRSGYYSLSFGTKDPSPFFNILYKSFSPVFLTFILSYLFYVSDLKSLNNNIYMVVPYYFILRTLFNIFSGKAKLMNWSREIVIVLFSLFIMYVVYIKLIAEGIYLLPDKQEVATAMWLGIIAFIYKAINDADLLKEDNSLRKNRYIETSYSQFELKYGYIIDSETVDTTERLLVYAVLIYESFNRSRLHRLFERTFFFTGKIKTTGIMQVQSDTYLSDFESVKKGTDKLIAKYREETASNFISNGCNNTDSALENTILDYNYDSNYYDEIVGIIEHIRYIE